MLAQQVVVSCHFSPLSQFRHEEASTELAEYGGLIRQLNTWIDDYLCKPHKDLGRPGPVCPFVPTALEKDLLFVSIYPDFDHDSDPHEVIHAILNERDRFLALPPRTGNNAQFKCTIVLFPRLAGDDVSAQTFIDAIQTKLQRNFVNEGLMIGEFHAGPPNKEGLWNEQFRPLDCPIPLIAIRHMVPTDILFLKNESMLVTQYLRRYGDMVPSRFKHLIEDAAERFGFDLPENQQGSSSAPTVIYTLEKHKLPYQVHRHASAGRPIHRPTDFAKALDYDVARISKALFVRDPKREQYAILVLGATRKANLSVVASEMGVSRLELADDDELERLVGHPRYAVTPIGVDRVPAFIDEGLMQWSTILTGAGVAKMEIELAPGDLQQLSQAKVLPFSE